jgi:competence protein ComEA
VQNRMTWVLGSLAAAATAAAVGVGLNGWRTTPPPDRRPRPANTASGNPQDADPMAPRLLDQGGSIRIHVAGAVKKPGVYAIPSWYRVSDAMKRAGGPSADADLDAINLADHLKDGEQLRIPRRGRPERLQAHLPTPEPPPPAPGTGGHAAGRYPFARSAAATPAAAEPLGPINLNTADRESLDALPGVGPSTADKIIAYRQEQGPFLRAEDLMNVKGIGPAKFERLRGYVEAP